MSSSSAPMITVTGMGSPTHATGSAGPTMSPSHFDITAPCLCVRLFGFRNRSLLERPKKFSLSQMLP
eukprot:3388612-Rhodomonas_salina.1